MCARRHRWRDLAEAAVVGDPLGVVRGLAVGEAAGDGLASDLGGPLVVGAVQVGWVGVAAAARAGAAGAALDLGAGSLSRNASADFTNTASMSVAASAIISIALGTLVGWTLTMSLSKQPAAQPISG